MLFGDAVMRQVRPVTVLVRKVFDELRDQAVGLDTFAASFDNVGGEAIR